MSSLWTPDSVRPSMPVVNGALADLRRQERDRWRHVRDPRVEHTLQLAAAWDAANTNTANAASGSVAVTLGSITDGYIAVGIIIPTSAGTPGCTIDSVSASQITGTGTGDNFGRGSQLFVFGKIMGATSGSKTCAFTWSGTHSTVMIALSFSGIDQTTPFQNGNKATTDFGDASISKAVASASGNITVDFTGTAGSTAPTLPSQTSRGSAGTINATEANSLWCSTAAGSASNTHSWTTAVNGSYESIFDLIASGAAAALAIPVLTRQYRARTH